MFFIARLTHGSFVIIRGRATEDVAESTTFTGFGPQRRWRIWWWLCVYYWRGNYFFSFVGFQSSVQVRCGSVEDCRSVAIWKIVLFLHQQQQHGTRQGMKMTRPLLCTRGRKISWSIKSPFVICESPSHTTQRRRRRSSSRRMNQTRGVYLRDAMRSAWWWLMLLRWCWAIKLIKVFHFILACQIVTY